MVDFDRVVNPDNYSRSRKRAGRPKKQEGKETPRDIVIKHAAERIFSYQMLFPAVQQDDEAVLVAVRDVAVEQGGACKLWWDGLLRLREHSECDNGLNMAINAVRKQILDLEKFADPQSFSRSHPDKPQTAPELPSVKADERSGTSQERLDTGNAGASVRLKGERRENDGHFLGNPD